MTQLIGAFVAAALLHVLFRPESVSQELAVPLQLKAYLPPYGWVSFDLSGTQKIVASTRSVSRRTASSHSAGIRPAGSRPAGS